jgi:hypothetical protein
LTGSRNYLGENEMRVARAGFVFLCLTLIFSIPASSLHAESYLYVEERIDFLGKKIEAGSARGSLTRNEYARLVSRLSVLKHKSSKYRKDGTTERQYLELERDLTGLEKDTERLLNSLKRR